MHVDVNFSPMEFYTYDPFKVKEKNQAEIFSKIERQSSSDLRKCSKEVLNNSLRNKSNDNINELD